MNDTHPEAERRQIALIRQLTGGERVLRAMQMSDLGYQMTRDALARACPDLNRDDIDRRMLELMYGRELASRAHRHALGLRCTTTSTAPSPA